MVSPASSTSDQVPTVDGDVHRADQPPLKWRIGFGLIAVLLAGSALFSTLAPYDDEGYVMMTLRTYMQGDRLYGETHTQYGPAFYYLTAPIHALCELPLTQTGVRAKTCVVWLAAVWLCYAIVKRISSSGWAGLTVACLAAVHLDKLALEPGHPQEIALLSTLGMLWVLAAIPDASSNATRTSTWLLAGMLAAIAGMTKLNCGLVLAVPLIATAVYACAVHRPINRSLTGYRLADSRFLRWSLIGFVIGPALLVAWHARFDRASWLWSLSIAAIAGCFVNAFFATVPRTPAANEPSDRSPRNPLLLVAMAGGMTTASIIALALLQGIQPAELWFGLVGQHANFAQSFFQPIRFSWLTALAWIATLLWWVGQRKNGLTGPVGVAVACGVTAAIASTAWRPLEHGLQLRGAGGLLAGCAPLWVAICFSQSTARSTRRFCLGLVAILSPLIAFPVAGTQIELGTLPSLIALGVCLGDYRTRRIFMPTPEVHLFKARRLADGTSILTIGAMITLGLGTTGHLYRYAKGVPLRLLGSEAMRLPAEVVAEQRLIVASIERCAAPGLLFEGHTNNRFYFWTGKQPLTAANPTFWPRMLSREEQAKLVDAIERQSRICIVRVPNYEKFYGPYAVDIRQHLESRWQPVASIADWQIGIVEGEAKEL